MRDRRQWNTTSSAERKIKVVKPELHIQEKLFFKDESEIMKFAGKQSLKN